MQRRAETANPCNHEGSGCQSFGLAYAGTSVVLRKVQVYKHMVRGATGGHVHAGACGVNHCAQIWINGRLADTRLWRPYRADITSLLRPGENEITILVSNLASNERRHMLVDEGMALGWNRYWNEDNMDRDSRNYVSGLLGPVRLLHMISPKP